MTGDMKGLTWFRLVLLQLLVGSVLIGFCAYFFRVPVEEVRVVSTNPIYSDQSLGMLYAMEINYPGLGKLKIDDPKELLKLRETFYELIVTGSNEKIKDTSPFRITGVIYYLDQEPVEFGVNAKSFLFNGDMVNSLNVSATIRKLQGMFIDKALTEVMINEAINKPSNKVFSLVNGQLLALTDEDRAELSASIKNAARVIDFSPITKLEYKPKEHFVIQLNQVNTSPKHWLHIDLYDGNYFVVYDLLDETNHKAYFKISPTN